MAELWFYYTHSECVTVDDEDLTRLNEGEIDMDDLIDMYEPDLPRRISPMDLVFDEAELVD